MQYRVEITRVEYQLAVVVVDADDEPEAMEKADEARCDADFSVMNAEEFISRVTKVNKQNDDDGESLVCLP